MTKRRVIIADDHALMAEGLARILAPEYEIVAICQDGRQLVTQAVDLRPEIVCLDIGMPLLNRIQETFGQIRIAYLPMHSHLANARSYNWSRKV